MPTFRPSCVVNFKMFFDESLHPVTTPSPVTVDMRVRNPPTGPSGATTAQTPLMMQRPDENASWIYGRIPKRASVEDPGFRQAGKFDMTLDFKDLPLDPRTVRAAAVEIHMGAVPHGDFARGMTKVEQDGTRRSVIATRKNGDVRADTLRMLALVDVWQVDEADNGAEVTLQGRDLRGPLLDTPLGTDPSIAQQILGQLDLSQTIDQVVTQLLRFNPLFDLIQVKTNAAEWDNQEVPTCAVADIIPRHRKGARGGRAAARASMPGESTQMSFWDLIVQLTFLVGGLPYFANDKLIIRPARSIYDQSRTTGFDPSVSTPFLPDQARQVQGVDQPVNIRWLVYGRDAQKIHFERKFGGFQKPKTVRCVSINPDSGQRGLGQIIQAQWPPATAPDAARTNRVSPSARQSQEDILTIRVPKVVDSTRLLSIAQNLYEQISRLEMGGTATTQNLASFGGDNTDPDLLRLRPGDGVIFYTDVRELQQRNPLVSTITDHYRTPFETRVDEIKARIGDEALARAIVATARGQSALVQRAFRTSTVKLDWDAAKGVTIEFDFQNYYEPRFVADSAGTTPGSVSTQTVPSAASGGIGNIGPSFDTFFTGDRNTSGGSTGGH